MPMKNDIKIKVSTGQSANVEQIKRDIKIKASTEQNINVDLSNRVTIKTIEADHSKLDNLDYEHSGHSGFMPSKLSILPKVPKAIQNGRLSLAVYDNISDQTSNIEFDELRERIIKTANTFSNTDQKGQYIFLEINKEEN